MDTETLSPHSGEKVELISLSSSHTIALFVCDEYVCPFLSHTLAFLVRDDEDATIYRIRLESRKNNRNIKRARRFSLLLDKERYSARQRQIYFSLRSIEYSLITLFLEQILGIVEQSPDSVECSHTVLVQNFCLIN